MLFKWLLRRVELLFSSYAYPKCFKFQNALKANTLYKHSLITSETFQHLEAKSAH